MHGAAYKNLPGAVKFLAAKGARIDVWNRENKFGWTPLVIAAGYRFGNFKPSPDTEAALREVMIAAGVTPPDMVDARMVQIYGIRSRALAGGCGGSCGERPRAFSISVAMKSR